MKKLFCKRCATSKPVEEFPKTSSTWCRDCHKSYLSEYRTFREYPSKLTDKEMDRELRGYKPPECKGLNDLKDLTAQFENACKTIKNFPRDRKFSRENRLFQTQPQNNI